MPFIQMIDKNLEPSRQHAVRFGLWIGMASIVMLFAALTSAYLVRKAAGNWYEFKLPVQFFFSTVLIVASSVLLEKAYLNFKSGRTSSISVLLFVALFLGFGFLFAQIWAWKELFAQGVSLDLNVSSSFLYALSGLHALHVIGGIAALALSAIASLSERFKPTKNRLFKLDLVRQYWHFVDILWIYLLLFLILQ